MDTARRIRAFRIRAGKSQADVARKMDLNIAWYADLETRNEEFASTLTMFKVMELASILGVPLHELLDEPVFAGDRLALIDLPQHIVAHADRERISIEQLENRVGWELREFIAAPVQSASEMPIEFFQAIAATLGISWLALLPPDEG
jgi:transcriptional regulator with XRE-family HTH domain